MRIPVGRGRLIPPRAAHVLATATLLTGLLLPGAGAVAAPLPLTPESPATTAPDSTAPADPLDDLTHLGSSSTGSSGLRWLGWCYVSGLCFGR